MHLGQGLETSGSALPLPLCHVFKRKPSFKHMYAKVEVWSAVNLRLARAVKNDHAAARSQQ